MLYDSRKEYNSGIVMASYRFKCDDCGNIMDHLWPIYEKNNNVHYCGECALRNNFIDGKTFCRDFLYCLDGYDAVLQYDPELGRDIVRVMSKKESLRFHARQPHKDRRNTPEYNNWRIAVYYRDNYTCQHCPNPKRGGELNAHHIKSYARYPKLRLNVDNGITLCVSCHKKVHKTRSSQNVRPT